MSDSRYSIDEVILKNALLEKGFRNYRELADHLKIHRNTISNYLSGGTIFPDSLLKIIDTLELDPKLLIKKEVLRSKLPSLKIYMLVDQLAAQNSQSCLVLFGSRARGTPKKYSDYDVGVFNSNKITFPEFSNLLSIVSDWNENELSSVDLTNLTSADFNFLETIKNDIIFVTGSLASWLTLLKQLKIEPYE